MKSHLLTPFFSRFFGGDESLSEELVNVYEQLQYYFISNFYSYVYLLDLQIFLRFSLKMEYAYTDGLTPIELHIVTKKATDLEEEKKRHSESQKTSS